MNLFWTSVHFPQRIHFRKLRTHNRYIYNLFEFIFVYVFLSYIAIPGLICYTCSCTAHAHTKHSCIMSMSKICLRMYGTQFSETGCVILSSVMLRENKVRLCIISYVRYVHITLCLCIINRGSS